MFETFPCVGVAAQGPTVPRGIPGSSIHWVWQEKPKFLPGILHQSQQGFSSSTQRGQGGSGGMGSWGAEGAASASPGSSSSPLVLGTNHLQPSFSQSCFYSKAENKSALPKIPHNQRLYDNKMVFSYCYSERPGSAQKFSTQTCQVKHCLKLKILPLASPPPPLFL